jgi:hypothetical protein
MSLDASEVVVGANGRVLVAPADSATFPEDMSSMGAEWVEVGYVSEDGVTFTAGQEIEDIMAWQSFYAIRKVVTGKTVSVEFAMRQWNEDTVVFAFGGGEVTRAAGVATYVPAEPGDLDERAVCVEWEDGADTYRLVLPRGIVTGEVSSNVTRSAAADLPVSFEITPDGLPDGSNIETNPWYLLTDADGFALT